MELIAAVRDCATCAAGGLALMTLLIVVAAFLRYHDRAIPTWLIPTTAFAYGVGASLMVLLWPVTTGPVESVLFLALAFAPALLAARSRRFDLAGWILIGAGLIPLLFWAYYVVQDLRQEEIAYEDGLVVWFGSSAAIVLLGLVGVVLGNRLPKAPPRPPPGEPDPERGIVIARAILEELRFGPLDLPNALSIGLAAGVGVGLSLVLGALGVPVAIGGIVSVAVSTLIATELYYHVWPPRLARAEAAHAFRSSWEVRRFRATTGGPPPTSIPLAREWLARHPETDENRWTRPEFLAVVGEVDEAYQVLGRLPSDTDDERFERQSLKVFLDTLAGTDPDVDALAAAAEEIGEPGSDERLRAVAAAAIAHSRLILARGEKDWTAPLLEAQARIGPRSLGILRSDTWLPRFRMFALVGVMVIVFGTTISWVFR